MAREILGNNGDVQLIRDGKTFLPKEMFLSAEKGIAFTWRQRHWNTGVDGMAGAFDVVHRLPKGLNKPKEPDLERANPYQWKCVHCGTKKVYGADHYATKYRHGGGYCETWIETAAGWKLFSRKEW